MEAKRRNKTKYLPTYTITLENGQELQIKPTANAWWKKEYKVRLLLAFLGEGYNIREACKKIGIKPYSYKYFVKSHPEITDIRKYYKNQLIEEARGSVARAIKKDKKFALRYFYKTKPEEFPRPALLNKISRMEEEFEKERDGYLDEIREVKAIMGMYMEVFHDLKKDLGGWYLEQVLAAEKRVREYNSVYKRKI